MSRLIDSLNSEQLINSPTHFTKRSSSRIDLMFIKHSTQILSSFVADRFVLNLVRFHCPTVVVLKFTKPKQTSFQRKIWIYDKDQPTVNPNLDATANTIANSFLKAASESIPNTNVNIRPGDVPWMNKEVKQQIRKRNKLHQRTKLSNNQLRWEQFRKYRNETTQIIRTTKKEYEHKLFNKINSDKITQKQTSPPILTLIDKTTKAESDEEKADLLNTYFKQTINHRHPAPSAPYIQEGSVLFSFRNIFDEPGRPRRDFLYRS